MKSGLLIDFDGTLCFDYFWRSLATDSRKRVQKLLFQGYNSLVDDWMRGLKTAEDIAAHASESLDIEYEELWNCFETDCLTMHVEPDTLDHIRDMQSRFQTILVTDNMDSFDRFTLPSLRLNEYFNATVNSARWGVLKGDKAGGLFAEVIAQYGLDVKTTHLIDNSEKNCRIFEELGGQSHLVHKREDIDTVLESISSFTDGGVHA